MNEKACAINIGPRELWKRWIFGTLAGLSGVASGLWLLTIGVDRPWRLMLFFPFWMGALGFFQAKDQVCVVLAAQGRRHTEGAVEKIQDLSFQNQIRRQAVQVHVKALLTAAAVTAVWFIL